MTDPYKGEIYVIETRIKDLQRKIRRYNQELNGEKLNRRLTLIKYQGPRIVNADELMSSYRFLDEALVLLGVTLYPINIEMECTYPRWAQKVDALQLLPFTPNKSAKNMEILADAIASTLNMSIEEANIFIEKHKIRVPRVSVGTYEIKNINIDFSTGEPYEMMYDVYENSNSSDELSLDDDQIMHNTVIVKMLLIIPNK